MTMEELAVLRALVNAAKGARDTLDCWPPRESRIRRDIRRLDAAIGEGEALMRHEKEKRFG